jgi:hypothetical protein
MFRLLGGGFGWLLFDGLCFLGRGLVAGTDNAVFETAAVIRCFGGDSAGSETCESGSSQNSESAAHTQERTA